MPISNGESSDHDSTAYDGGTSIPDKSVRGLASLAWEDWYGTPGNTGDVEKLRQRLAIDRHPDDCATAMHYVRLLGESSRRAIPELKQLMRHAEQKSLRMNAATVIAEIDPAESAIVLPVLLAGLADNDRGIWASATHGLGFLGTAAMSAIPQLKAMLEIDDEMTIVSAAGAIVRIAPSEHESVIPILVELLKESDSFYQGFVIDILAEIGPSAVAAVELLRQLSVSDETLTSQEASIAVGKVTGDWNSALDVGVRLFKSLQSTDEDNLPTDAFLDRLVAQGFWLSLGPHAVAGIPRLEAECGSASDYVRERIQETVEWIRSGKSEDEALSSIPGMPVILSIGGFA